MSKAEPSPFPYAVSGLSTLVAPPMPIDQWAEQMQIPHRHRSGESLEGTEIERILGIEAKSWAPDLFGDFDTMVALGREALRSAGIEAGQVDAFIALPCNPFEVMLDQDAFKLSRRIGLRDSLVPVQMIAGCAGIARAAALATTTGARHILIVTYSVPSVLSGSTGALNDLYRFNRHHPDRDSLWAAAGTFSDSASAMVLSRSASQDGTTVFYSRDTDAFDENPLVRFPGGGLNHPPGTPHADEMSCFGLDGKALAHFYSAAMLLNHRDLQAAVPGYTDKVERIYTHQAGPALVDDFLRRVGLGPDKAPTNAREFGNLITTATTKLLHDDMADGRVVNGDRVCLSVVGAGPERGALITHVDIADPVPPRTGRAEKGNLL
ncbi:3-oxoacyl-[acyl-carrier-protein] synthase III C-terminal domain-containing protein [Actinomadura rubrisoli]|uniref:Beta-ketoacyl-[acyl-carrier-protein] synthase III C-terminal domain-containing protein n=1 Tax=Actinomadura rubrisoli TaxID=2530368 RepID=A0A4R5C891_9ACTN|nr:3-oxoacyl-[acyl-carrier-protein] synthase III C-terminal domain-containing protein [Actinomadura rubrisoli]TDD94340.1 hypothetical protein E1298_07005 [Actinomadura rubrisoli]